MPTVHHGHDQSGTTAQRPTNADVGFAYWDTTLSQTVVWNGSAWKDTLGNTPTAAGAGSVPSAVAATVVATEYTGPGGYHRTRLTLTDMPQAVVNGTEYQGTQIYDFPEGRIFVQGVVATLAQKTTSALAGTLNASSTGSLGLGTVVASATTLASTMVDLGPATAFTSSAVVNVAGTAVSPVLAAAAAFDGTATAKDMYLNSAYATTADVDGDATQTWTGTIDIVWIMLGDK